MDWKITKMDRYVVNYRPMNFSEEQILALAPDDASRKSGKELASPAKWVSKGADERALWGECQGSGSKPYQTQIDLANHEEQQRGEE